MDIWQPGTHEGTPSTQGLTQLRSYHQIVLGEMREAPRLEEGAAVVVLGNLAGYLGNEELQFASTRRALGLQGRAAGEGEAQTVGLLPATSPVRATAERRAWDELAAWKPTAVLEGTIMAPHIEGDRAAYRAAWQRHRSVAETAVPPPRPLLGEAASFVEMSDYALAADPAGARGVRADEADARAVADILQGFTQ